MTEFQAVFAIWFAGMTLMSIVTGGAFIIASIPRSANLDER